MTKSAHDWADSYDQKDGGKWWERRIDPALCDTLSSFYIMGERHAGIPRCTIGNIWSVECTKFYIGATAEGLYADKIEWLTQEPVWVSQWPLTQEEVEALEQLVQEQLEKGHIVESNSPWNTPVFVIGKKIKKMETVTGSQGS